MWRQILAFSGLGLLGVVGLVLAQHGHGDGKGPEVKVLSAVDVEEEVSGKKAKATTFEVTFGPGVEGAPHRHPGPIFGYVIEGEFDFAVGDGKVQKLKAGGLCPETLSLKPVSGQTAFLP